MQHITPLTVALPRRRFRWRVNAPLLVGGGIVGALLLCAVAAPLLAPHGPDDLLIQNTGGQVAAPPYAPGTPGLLLGSDRVGRDMLSRLIYGAQLTLLFCSIAATVRIVLGASLGIAAVWYPRVRRIVDVLVSAWSAIPSLFFALLPISLINVDNDPSYITQSTIAFIVVLSLTGWTEAAVRTRIAVQAIRSEAFIESAAAIGLSRWRVLWRHVLPNLRDVLLVEATFAMAATLLLVGELAFLGFFVGGAYTETFGGTIVRDPIYAEWGSLLATGLRQRNLGYWMLIEPILAFSIAILGFNLLAEGLRRRGR